MWVFLLSWKTFGYTGRYVTEMLMIRINFRGLSSIVEHVEDRVALSLCATN